jgi:uncharacterized protein with HEPN domain
MAQVTEEVLVTEKDKATLTLILTCLNCLQGYLANQTAVTLAGDDMRKDAIGLCVVVIRDSIKQVSYTVQNASSLGSSNAWWLRSRQLFAHKYEAVNWTRAFNDLTAEGRISSLQEKIKALKI